MYFYPSAKNQGQKSQNLVYGNSKSLVRIRLDHVFCSVITTVSGKRNLTPSTTGSIFFQVVAQKPVAQFHVVSPSQTH